MSEPVAVVRVCRFCGVPALLEPHEHRVDDPWACERCVRWQLENAPYLPDWTVRAGRPLRSMW